MYRYGRAIGVMSVATVLPTLWVPGARALRAVDGVTLDLDPAARLTYGGGPRESYCRTPLVFLPRRYALPLSPSRPSFGFMHPLALEKGLFKIRRPLMKI